jgi:hypothetical protein
MTPEQIQAFGDMVRLIVTLDEGHEVDEDFDAHEKLLNDLYGSVQKADFERFVGIIQDANDPAFRCPQ